MLAPLLAQNFWTSIPSNLYLILVSNHGKTVQIVNNCQCLLQTVYTYYQGPKKKTKRICNQTNGRCVSRGTAAHTLLWKWVEFQLQVAPHFLMFCTSHLKARINKSKFAYRYLILRIHRNRVWLLQYNASDIVYLNPNCCVCVWSLSSAGVQRARLEAV